MSNELNLKGHFVSVWRRKSRRHKWRCALPFVLVTYDETDETGRRISYQRSDSGGSTSTGWTSCRLGRFPDGAERKIEPPVFDVEVLR